MELLLYWKIVKKRLWLIVLLGVVAAASAAYFGLQQVPLYSSSTTLYLNLRVPSPLLPYQTQTSAETLSNTYVEFMRTNSFAGLIAQELETPMTEKDILEALSTRLVPGTQFFRISAIHPDPQQAQALANTAANALIAENISRQQAEREQAEAQRDPGADLERQRLVELQNSLEDEVDLYGDRLADIQIEIAELKAIPPSEETDQRILELRGELVHYQSMRAEMFGSLAGTQAALASISEQDSSSLINTAVVVDPAPLPTVPESRNLVQYTFLAAIAGIGLGVGLAFLLEYLDWTIKTPEELDAIYGLNTLGVIGTIKGSNHGQAGPQVLVTMTQPKSPVAEAFRALRTNIRFASPDHPVRSLLVTSAGPQEGKTLTASNLAVVLAQSGRRVILVDADLRRPRLHRLFDVAREPGFANLVLDRARPYRVTREEMIETYLQVTWMDTLRVLTCGPVPRSPAELLTSDRVARVMEQLQDIADVVIYDSPPAATVTDAAILASRVDAVIQVVKAGDTRRDVVLRVKSTLEKVGGRVLGPVLNYVSPGDMGYYSYYYYGYYHDEDDREKEKDKEPAPRQRPSLQQGRSPAAIAARRLGTQIESESGQAEP
jgi:succinoglycan biosynthesis transport protein ExoP